ncbi:MAG: AraC family transcriptional regulator [Oscillospiraceae bacterium]|nr:AraC family transcriptional regulator [Oscillospiraceae bacterium]
MANWVEQLNNALVYIDDHLCDEIDYHKISRITACPIEALQRVFVLNAGITLTEYIRRRKLYEAFVELRTTTDRIIDIAVKYGYNSPDAFGVAFKRVYGVSPAKQFPADMNTTSRIGGF